MMKREPATVPAKPGVYAIVNKKRRFAYVAYTTTLMKRSHSIAYMLKKHDEYRASTDPKHPEPYWSISELPKHDSDEYTFMTLAVDVRPGDASDAVLQAQELLRGKRYAIVDGNRTNSETVTFQGKPMALTDALARSGSKVKYATAYRRLQRGWTIEQVLGLAPPDPKWDTVKRSERAQRTAGRTAT